MKIVSLVLEQSKVPIFGQNLVEFYSEILNLLIRISENFLKLIFGNVIRRNFERNFDSKSFQNVNTAKSNETKHFSFFYEYHLNSLSLIVIL